MVGHTLPHFPILLFLTPLPPLYVTRAHTFSPVYVSPSSKSLISLSLVYLPMEYIYNRL